MKLRPTDSLYMLVYVGGKRERERGGGAIGLLKKERHSFNATGMREKKKRKLSNTTSKLLGRPM